jgi:hypothetical protein
MNPKPRRVRIGSRSVRFACAGDLAGLEHHVLAIWSPSPPSRWKPGQLAKYCEARDAFLAEMDAAIGCKPIVLDKIDPVDVAALRQAAEVLLAARAAGVSCSTDDSEIRYHGDPPCCPSGSRTCARIQMGSLRCWARRGRQRERPDERHRKTDPRNSACS